MAAGEITDKEFANQIVAIRGGEEMVSTVRSGEQNEPPYNVEELYFFTEALHNPDGTSLQNIREVISKWERIREGFVVSFCKSSHRRGREF